MSSKTVSRVKLNRFGCVLNSSCFSAVVSLSTPFCVSVAPPSKYGSLHPSSPSLQNKDPGGGVGSTSRGWRLVGLGVGMGGFRDQGVETGRFRSM